MEFRDPSWYIAETFELLDRRRVALCLHDKLGSTIATPFVGPCVYVRFHGTSGHYHGSYSRRELDRWAHVLAEQTLEGGQVYTYFNNDPEAVATANAQTPVLDAELEGPYEIDTQVDLFAGAGWLADASGQQQADWLVGLQLQLGRIRFRGAFRRGGKVNDDQADFRIQYDLWK